jgi:hypothetical protein
VDADVAKGPPKELDPAIADKFQVRLRRSKRQAYLSLAFAFGVPLFVYGFPALGSLLVKSPPPGSGPWLTGFFAGGFIFLLLAAIAEGIAYRVTWRCPKCEGYLGESRMFPGWDITHCRYCGVRLR